MGARRVDWAAEKRVAKKRARVMGMMADPHGEVTVKVWLSAYLELFPSERSVKAEREHLGTLRAFRAEYGKLKVSAVTPLLAQGWALRHPGQVRHLSRAWAKALVMGVADVNVWRLVTLPKRAGERVRAPSELELRGILGRCREQGGWWLVFADLIEVAAYTGARQAGLIGLRRSQVDLGAGRMVLTEKGGKARTVVLAGPARAAMGRRLADYPPCLPARNIVFRSQRREALSAYVVQEAWRQVRGEFPHGSHSLRHYAASWLASQGVSPLDIATQLGHTTDEGKPYVRLVEGTYDHHFDDVAALRRIDEATG